MFEKDIKRNEAKYVSCIKINGSPILPPLITHAKRKELHRYKLQAVKLEKRLKREQELRQYINKYYTYNSENCPNILTTSLEHRLSFEDDLISHLNDNDNELSTNNVPLTVEKKTSSLSCDLQVSQYANNEFTVLTSFGNCKSDIIVIDEPVYLPSFPVSNRGSDIDISSSADQKPRLIRSNSYTLESPSPMLLAHLRKRNESVGSAAQDLAPISRDLIDERARHVESRDLRLESVNSQEGQDYLDVSRTESELRNISTCLSDQISNGDDLTVMGNQYQLKAFIDNNVPQMLDKEYLQESDNRSNKSNNSDCSNVPNRLDNLINNSDGVSYGREFPDYDQEGLREVLNNIPDIYSRQILELLDKQQFRGKSLKGKDAELKSPSCYGVPLQNERERVEDCKNNGCMLECDSINSADKSVMSLVGVSQDIPETISKDFQDFYNLTVLNCSRELFPNCDKERSPWHTKEHAASIIGAAAKGYLIRRLMRTDRVQNLIQTIREALICAMELHSESSDNINESDVELHRRLIQQVSAACFEFHDVFFAINTSEQMAIIRTDRERQKEKLKRPLSRVSSAGKSSRSSRSK